jgi:DNA-binding transcriptional ArsR family regulator
MEHFKHDHDKAAALPMDLDNKHGTDFNLIDEPADQAGGFFLNQQHEVPAHNACPTEIDNGEIHEDLGVIETLSPRQFSYYRVVTYLISQPDFMFIRPNAGGELYRKHGFSIEEWAIINQKLNKKHKVMRFQRQDNTPTRSKAVLLDLDNLLSLALNPKQPFITQGLLEQLKKRLDDDDIELDTEEKDHYKKQITEIVNARSNDVKMLERRKRRAEIQKRYRERVNENRAKKAQEVVVNAPEQEKKATKREQQTTTKKPDKLIFNFIYAGHHFHETYDKTEFGKIGSMERLIHGVGLTASFAKSFDEQLAVTHRILNKWAKEDEKLDHESLLTLFEQAKMEKLIVNGGPVFRPTEEAIIKIKRATWINRSNRLKGDSGEKTDQISDDPDSLINSSDADEELNSKETPELENLSDETLKKILDILIDDNLEEKINSNQPDEDGIFWKYPKTNEDAITHIIAAEKSVNDGTVGRWIRSLRNMGYAEIIQGHGMLTTNVGITEIAAAYWKNAHEAKNSEDLLNTDTEKIDLLDSLNQTGMELAEAVGNRLFIEKFELKFSHEYIGAVEKDSAFLDSQLKEVESIIENLRAEYVARFAGRQAINS